MVVTDAQPGHYSLLSSWWPTHVPGGSLVYSSALRSCGEMIALPDGWLGGLISIHSSTRFRGRTRKRVADDHVAATSRTSARWASSATRIAVLLVIFLRLQTVELEYLRILASLKLRFGLAALATAHGALPVAYPIEEQGHSPSQWLRGSSSFPNRSRGPSSRLRSSTIRGLLRLVNWNKQSRSVARKLLPVQWPQSWAYISSWGSQPSRVQDIVSRPEGLHS